MSMSWASSMALETGNLTSCEMRNDYRALVLPVMGVPGTAFFGPPG